MTAALKPPPAKRPASPSVFAMQREIIRSWQYDDWGNGPTDWEAHCADRFYLLRTAVAELAISQRRLLVRAFRLVGMSGAAIASALGVSESTVHDDRRHNGEQDEPAEVVSLNGSRRKPTIGRKPEPAPEGEPSELAEMTHTDLCVHLTRLEGDRGLTVRELRLLTEWHHGNASGTMSRVARQKRVIRAGRTRMGYGVYVVASE